MLRVVRSILGRRITLLPLRRLFVPSRLQNSITASPLVKTSVNFTTNTRDYSIMAPATTPNMKVVNGKVPVSIYEQNDYLDYEKYERNLKIVRDRFWDC